MTETTALLHVAGRPDLPVDPSTARSAWETARQLAGLERRRVRRHPDGDGYVIAND